MDFPCQAQTAQLKIATLRKFDKVMRIKGFNYKRAKSSQKSTYSFFEENLGDINVLDEASEEDSDLNSSCHDLIEEDPQFHDDAIEDPSCSVCSDGEMLESGFDEQELELNESSVQAL
jgi:hypothetical protein